MSKKGRPAPKKRAERRKALRVAALLCNSTGSARRDLAKLAVPPKTTADRVDFTYWASGTIIALISVSLSVPILSRLALLGVSVILGLKLLDLWLGYRYGVSRRLMAYGLTAVPVVVLTWYLYGLPEWQAERAADLSGVISSASVSQYVRNGFKKLEIGTSGAFLEVYPEVANRVKFDNQTYDSPFAVDTGPDGLEITTEVRDAEDRLVVKIDKNH